MTPVSCSVEEPAVVLISLKVERQGYFIGVTSTAFMLDTIKVAHFVPKLLTGYSLTQQVHQFFFLTSKWGTKEPVS